MDWLDIVIIIVLIAGIVRGIDKGFARQLLPAGGFFWRLILGSIFAKHLLAQHSNSHLTGSAIY